MLGVIGDLLPYSIPVALSPLPVIAVLLILPGPDGNTKGVFFLGGRLAALLTLVLLTSLLSGWLDQETEGEGGRVWLRFCLGVLLIAMSVRAILKPAPADAQPPGWMRAFDQAKPARAAGLGALLTIGNIKELAFAMSAGIVLGSAALSTGQAAACAAVYSLLATLSVSLPVGWVLFGDEESKAKLIPIRDWAIVNQSFIIAGVMLFIGTLLISDALAAL